MVTSQPPPRARPAGAVTTGTPQNSRRSQARWKARTIRSMSSQLPSMASIISIMRLAPAEKVSAPLVTTRARQFCSASSQAVIIMLRVSWPMAFILEWNSRPRTPSPRSSRLAPGLRLTSPLPRRSTSKSQARASTGTAANSPGLAVGLRRAPPSSL